MKAFSLLCSKIYGYVTYLHLSKPRHDIIITDNLSRKRVDIELGGRSLAPIYTIIDRINVWFEVTGRVIRFIEPDIAYDFDKFTNSLKKEKPDSIVHSAEQRAAPYSRKNSQTINCTTFSNICSAHNNLNEIVEKQQDIHQNTACGIEYFLNPQDKAEENDLTDKNDQLRSFGWRPILIEDSLFGEVTEITKRCRQWAAHSKTQCVSYWTKHTQKQQAITLH